MTEQACVFEKDESAGGENGEAEIDVKFQLLGTGFCHLRPLSRGNAKKKQKKEREFILTAERRNRCQSQTLYYSIAPVRLVRSGCPVVYFW